jgi:hypothetical protein
MATFPLIHAYTTRVRLKTVASNYFRDIVLSDAT